MLRAWPTHTAGGRLSRPAALQLRLLQTGRRCQAFPIGPAALDLPGAWEGRRPPDEARGREALSAGTLLGWGACRSWGSPPTPGQRPGWCGLCTPQRPSRLASGFAEPRRGLRGRVRAAGPAPEAEVPQLQVVPGQRVPGDEDLQRHAHVRRGTASERWLHPAPRTRAPPPGALACPRAHVHGQQPAEHTGTLTRTWHTPV